MTVATALPTTTYWMAAAEPPPSCTVNAKKTIWVNGMMKIVPSTKSSRMKPRLVLGENTAFDQKLRRKEGRSAGWAVWVAISVLLEVARLEHLPLDPVEDRARDG